jgi:hypothetical protein
VKWRTGGEGRISSLKHGYGWDRTRLDGTEGARIWTGHGVLAHNLVKIGALAANPTRNQDRETKVRRVLGFYRPNPDFFRSK